MRARGVESQYATTDHDVSPEPSHLKRTVMGGTIAATEVIDRIDATRAKAGGEMLSRIVIALLALCLLGTARPRADGGFLPALSLLSMAVAAVHMGRRLRAPLVTAGVRR